MGTLTKASLALRKAFISCGDRDLNWAMWQLLAAGRAVGTGTAPVLSTVVSSSSTSAQPTGESVMEGETDWGTVSGAGAEAVGGEGHGR